MYEMQDDYHFAHAKPMGTCLGGYQKLGAILDQISSHGSKLASLWTPKTYIVFSLNLVSHRFPFYA